MNPRALQQSQRETLMVTSKLDSVWVSIPEVSAAKLVHSISFVMKSQ